MKDGDTEDIVIFWSLSEPPGLQELNVTFQLQATLKENNKIQRQMTIVTRSVHECLRSYGWGCVGVYACVCGKLIL